jgi:hypothetical protein
MDGDMKTEIGWRWEGGEKCSGGVEMRAEI